MLARAALEPDLAGRSLQVAWEAALAASGLPVVGLDGPRGRPRFAAAAPLGATIPGEAELLDVWLTERLPRWRVREALQTAIPRDHALVDVYDVWLGEAALPGRVSASVYRAVLEAGVDVAAIRLAADALLAEPALPRGRRKGETMVAYDLRPFIEAIEVDDAGEAVLSTAGDTTITLRMTLRHDPERGVGRPEELLTALSERAGAALHARSLVRERLVLSTLLPPAEPAARVRGPRPGPGRGGQSPVQPGPATGQARRTVPPPRG